MRSNFSFFPRKAANISDSLNSTRSVNLKESAFSRTNGKASVEISKPTPTEFGK